MRTLVRLILLPAMFLIPNLLCGTLAILAHHANLLFPLMPFRQLGLAQHFSIQLALVPHPQLQNQLFQGPIVPARRRAAEAYPMNQIS